MTTALVVVLMLAVLIAVLFYVPRYFVKKAMRAVVALFRAAGATSPKKATTLAELGLVQQSILNRMMKPRDYKPYAARVLAQANVIKMTEEGRFYLSEAELDDSPVKQWAGIPDR